MRIISGVFRGVKLNSPKSENIRPTLDRVKEAIFNVIQFNIAEAVVLDLFCGSGAMGIEAISRGCKIAVLNDKSPEASQLIKENCKKAGIENPLIYSFDYKILLANLKAQNQKFDVVFIDPPYEGNTGIDSVNMVLDGNLLNSGGVIVFEHSTVIKISDFNIKQQHNIKSKKYGKVLVDFIYCIPKN